MWVNLMIRTNSANDGRNPWNSPPRARTPPRLGYSLPKMDATQGAYAKPYKPYDIFAEDDDDEDYLLIPNRHTAMNSSRLDELLSAPAVAHSRWDD
ncbi:hypothetical protein BV898_18260 [Hypsibius exemplaris]|uniref:Uncharacterized protein n=1 Tax=Hypsibius exemplaris TaxID=2072580 RepID=A0A9X6RMW4_HYPEX|nr:hypothetical protein BV898_18260 [Hypsibius exemplaris]